MMSYRQIILYPVLISGVFWDLGCTGKNPLYCDSNQDCRDPDFPLCDTTIHGCVGTPLEDGGLTDAGDLENLESQGFEGEESPGSDLTASKVIYVDDDSCPQKGSGTLSDPFCRIEDALDHIGGITGTVIIKAGSYTWDLITLQKDCQIRADGLVEIHTTQCPGIQIQQQAAVTIEGLTITGTGGIQVSGESVANLVHNKIVSTSCIGVHCLNATCHLSRNQILNNTGGGLKLSDSTFRLINNIIARNGEEAPFGGVWLEKPGEGSTFVNNTVAFNFTTGENPDGVNCSDPATLVNSILWENGEGDISGPCTVNFSDVSQEQGSFEGTDNINAEPEFMNEDIDDFHIQATSGCVDKAEASSAPSDDIDGQARPMGSGVDIGADEVR